MLTSLLSSWLSTLEAFGVVGGGGASPPDVLSLDSFARLAAMVSRSFCLIIASTAIHSDTVVSYSCLQRKSNAVRSSAVLPNS